MSSKTEDFFGEVAGMVLLLVGLSLVSLAWLVIHFISQWMEAQALLHEAQSIFDQVRAAEMPDLQVDPLLHAIFGEDLELSQEDAPGDSDWFIRAIYEPV